MRLAAAGLLVAALAAGCAAPQQEKPDPLFGYCPSWTPGPGQDSAHLAVAAGNTSYLRLEAPPSHDGLPLDLYRVRLGNLTGAVVLRAHGDEGGNRTAQLGIRTFRQDPPAFVPLVPFASAADTAREVEVVLSPLKGAPPHPGALWLGFTNEGSADAALDVSATFHYRVCGA